MLKDWFLMAALNILVIQMIQKSLYTHMLLVAHLTCVSRGCMTLTTTFLSAFLQPLRSVVFWFTGTFESLCISRGFIS
jgi:hypothetical protein